MSIPALIALLLLAFAPAAAPTEQLLSDCVETDGGMSIICSRPDSIAEVVGSSRHTRGCDLATIGLDMDTDGYTGPFVTISPDDCGKRCDLAEFAKAARGIAPYLEASDDHLTNDAVYRTPSQALREAAAEMDRRDAVIHTLRVDAAIHTLREQLDKCGWMAEPGAFDR